MSKDPPPVDDMPQPPPQSSTGVDYLTWDIMAELERAVLDKVDRVARECGGSHRTAARLVLEVLGEAP